MGCRPRPTGPWLTGAETVSYTHLDVYKRQVFHHDDKGVGIIFDVPQHGHILGGDLRAAQQYRGRTGDGGEGGAQVVGHRTEDIAPDGLPGGLQLLSLIHI